MKKAFFLLSTFSALMVSAQNVGIGTSTPATKLHIRGTADVSQLFIDANSTQSASQPLVRLRNGSGSDLLWINADHSSNAFVGLNTGRLNNATGGATGNSFFGSLAADSSTTGSNNTAIGREALASNIAGDNATAVGYQAMRYTNSTAGAFSNTNTAVGYQAMRGSTLSGNNTGTGNTAVGYQSMLNNSTGFNNTAYGRAALTTNTVGDNNTALGYQSLNDNTTGLNNTATGFQALFNNIDGDRNTAYGVSALLSNQGGNNGTAFGYGAMSLVNNQAASFTNTSVAFGYEALRGSASASANTGSGNSAVGYQALRNNSSGEQNTSVGYNSLLSNSTGIGNAAFGYNSLNANTAGSNNTVIGARALDETPAGSNATVVGYNAMSNYTNTATPFINYNVAVGFETLQGGFAQTADNTGNWNTAVGYQAATSNADGNYNTAVGVYSLNSNFSGNFNTAVGMYALGNNSISENTGVGYGAGSFNANTSNSTFLGFDADQSNGNGLFNSMALGYSSRVAFSNNVRIGNTTIVSIGGYASWTDLSDSRFKTDVREDVPGLEFIKLLRPVTYHVKVNELAAWLQEDRHRNERGEIVTRTPNAAVKEGRDAKERIIQTGFIAQEVEQSALSIGYQFSGVDAPKGENDLYGLRYAEFVVPLVKAVQEQQKMIEEQARINSRLQEQLDKLTAELELLKKNK